jgi:hypothetical protein
VTSGSVVRAVAESAAGMWRRMAPAEALRGAPVAEAMSCTMLTNVLGTHGVGSERR